MSARLAADIRKLREDVDAHGERLAKLVKDIQAILKSLSTLERGTRTVSDETVVPRVDLPKSLQELEIGSQPKG